MNKMLSILFLILLSGCESKNCPEFPKILKNYFPYENIDNIKFVNSSNDTLVFNVITYDVSDSYDIKWNCKCGCDSHLEYSMVSESSVQFNIEGRLSYSLDGNSSELYCNLDKEKEYSDKFYFNKNFDKQSLEESGDLLGDTIKILNENNYRYSEVTIVNNEGIVKFWEKETNDYWEKI